jgi:hypothetical protein
MKVFEGAILDDGGEQPKKPARKMAASKSKAKPGKSRARDDDDEIPF